MTATRAAIITGGLQGIGLAVAVELARGGTSVAVGARRANDPGVREAARRRLGDDAVIETLDVRSQDSIERFMRVVHDRIGGPDILVNAAGISVRQAVDGHSDEGWNAVLDTNLSGPFRMMRACLPEMKARRFGRIVNIASTAARVGSEVHPAYCASKAGLVGLTRAVALEGGPYGITCVAVSPGWVETEMLHEAARTIAARSGRGVADSMAEMAASNAQNRLVQPEEIAALVAFCCSDAAAALTMEDVQVTAGAIW